MKKIKNGKKHRRNDVVENLSTYSKEIERLDERYSKLNDKVKSLEKEKYRATICKIILQILASNMINDSLKEEVEEVIRWIEIIFLKIQ